MKASKIVPDVIPRAPKQQCRVFFETGASAELGNNVLSQEAKTPPLLIWTSNPNKFYTICMIDPDVEAKEWQHWLVGNIPGSNVCRGEVISEYIPPVPQMETGPHRYIILVYLQKKQLEFEEPKLSCGSGEGRQEFSIVEFAKKYGLGNPIAGNFYQTEYDEYVSSLSRSLGLDLPPKKDEKKSKSTKKSGKK